MMAPDANREDGPASDEGDRRPAGSTATAEPLLEGAVFSVERFEYLTDRGDRVRKDVVRHPGAVTVIPVDSDGRILMVQVGRLAVRRFLLEFCAGKLEPGEDPLDAARRELEEETGRSAGEIAPLGAYFTSPGFSDERMHAFVASDLRRVPQRLEVGEEIQVVSLEPEEIEQRILDGRLDDGKSIAAWHLFCRLGGRAS